MRLYHYTAPFCAGMLSILSSVAHAADSAGHGHEEKSAGLPQLDPTHFSSQIFWMVLVFAVSYYVFSKKVLPQIEAVLDRRTQMIDGDLAQAEKLNHEANRAKKHVEQTLRDARNQARQGIEGAQAESIHLVGQKIDEVDRVLHERLEQSEKAILAAKDAALTEFEGMAVPVVKDILGKVAALSLTEQQIVATLGQQLVQRERGRG